MNGEKIKLLRKEQRLSQEELARKANISRATLSFIENGLSENVALGTLRKLANALNVSIKDFL